MMCLISDRATPALRLGYRPHYVRLVTEGCEQCGQHPKRSTPNVHMSTHRNPHTQRVTKQPQKPRPPQKSESQQNQIHTYIGGGWVGRCPVVGVGGVLAVVVVGWLLWVVVLVGDLGSGGGMSRASARQLVAAGLCRLGVLVVSRGTCLLLFAGWVLWWCDACHKDFGWIATNR